MSATGRPSANTGVRSTKVIHVSATGRPEREYRSAQHEGSPVNVATVNA